MSIPRKLQFMAHVTFYLYEHVRGLAVKKSIELNFNARDAIEPGHFCCSSICCHITVTELVVAVPENRLLWCYTLRTTKQSFSLFTHRPAL